jgi:hypothetical protein
MARTESASDNSGLRQIRSIDRLRGEAQEITPVCHKCGNDTDLTGKQCSWCEWEEKRAESYARRPKREGSPNALPSWFGRIPVLIEQLHLTPADLLDRCAVEKLTGLQRTAAVDLMNAAGAHQIGKSLVITKGTLIARLRELQEHPSFSWKVDHRRRVSDELEEARATIRARAVKAPRPTAMRTFDELPGVQLGGGELKIEYTDTQDLVGKLFAFAKAISREPERFSETTQSTVTK